MAGEASVRCPECGAPDSACEARFHELLALEFEEAGYGAVHHLTVATYMLQHSSKLTRERLDLRTRSTERVHRRT